MRNDGEGVKQNAATSRNRDKPNGADSLFPLELSAAQPTRPRQIVCRQCFCEQPRRRREERHRVAWKRSGNKIDNDQRNYDSPTQTIGDIDLTLGGKLRVEQQRHKKKPGQKVTKTARNVQRPTLKIKAFSGEAPGKLSRPNVSDVGSARYLRERNRPRGKDRNHYYEPNQMWDVPKFPQFTRTP